MDEPYKKYEIETKTEKSFDYSTGIHKKPYWMYVIDEVYYQLFPNHSYNNG
jgi:hypothetical protein